MDDQPRDIEGLRSDIAFEQQTRGDRFERIADTDPEDPALAAILANRRSDDELDEDTLEGAVRSIVDTLSTSTVTYSRLFSEVGRSLHFDLQAVASLADKVAEQQVEIEQLRRAVEDLRRGR